MKVLNKKDYKPLRPDSVVYLLEVGLKGQDSIIICLRNNDGEKAPIVFTSRKEVDEFISYQSEHFIQSKNRFSTFKFIQTTLGDYLKTTPHDLFIVDPDKDMDYDLRNF